MSNRYEQRHQEKQSRSVNYDRLAVEEALENIKRRERLAQYSVDKVQNEQQLRDAEQMLPTAKQRLDEAMSRMEDEGITIEDTEAWDKLVSTTKDAYKHNQGLIGCGGAILALVAYRAICYFTVQAGLVQTDSDTLITILGFYIIPVITFFVLSSINNADKKMSAFEKAHKTEYKYYDAEREYEELVSTKQRCEEFLSQPVPPDCTYEYVGRLTDTQQNDQDLLEAILRYFDGGRATNARDATNLYYEELDRKQQVEYTRQAAQNTRQAANYAAATYSRMSDIAEKQADANRDMNRQIGDLAQHVHDTNRRIDDMQG